MKKLLLTATAFLLILLSEAQTYHPMLDSANTWYYAPNFIPVQNINATSFPCTYGNFSTIADKVYSTGDTVMNGFTYKILLYDDYFNSSNCTFGYLREDTAARRVYFVDNQFAPEVLEYDFSMVSGDSIQLSFYIQSGFDVFQNGYYRLDSIGTKSIAAGMRNTYFLSCHSCNNSHQLMWIESVGFQGDVAYTHGSNMPSFGFFSQCFYPFFYEYAHILTCFEHNQKVYLDSCSFNVAYNNWCFDYHDSCNYWNICGGVEEHTALTSVKIFPNPANDLLTVTMTALKNETMNFILKDVNGKAVLTQNNYLLHNGTNKIQLNISRLTPGFYMLECRTQNGSVFKKLVTMNR